MNNLVANCNWEIHCRGQGFRFPFRIEQCNKRLPEKARSRITSDFCSLYLMDYSIWRSLTSANPKSGGGFCATGELLRPKKDAKMLQINYKKKGFSTGSCCLTAVWLQSNTIKETTFLKIYDTGWKGLLSLRTDIKVKVLLSSLNTTNASNKGNTVLSCTYKPNDFNSSSSRQVEVVLLCREAVVVFANWSVGDWDVASSSEKSISV